MIQSSYILNILNLLCDCDDAASTIRSQVPFLTDAEYNYTGSGLFVYFTHTEGIAPYRLPWSYSLEGVRVESAKYEVKAWAILWTKDGFIDNLEIWCVTCNYPEEDLTSYVLIQELMEGGDGKRIEVLEEGL